MCIHARYTQMIHDVDPEALRFSVPTIVHVFLITAHVYKKESLGFVFPPCHVRSKGGCQAVISRRLLKKNFFFSEHNYYYL